MYSITGSRETVRFYCCNEYIIVEGAKIEVVEVELKMRLFRLLSLSRLFSYSLTLNLVRRADISIDITQRRSLEVELL